MLLLVAAMVLPSTAWAQEVTYTNGFGSDGSYQPATDSDGDAVYEIGNAGQLYWFAALVNGTLTDGTAQKTTAKAVLTADISVNTGVLNADGTLASDVSSFRSWTPIGNTSGVYTGTFDGQNHTVSGLYFNDSKTNYVGLFGYVGKNGKISNVGVVDSYFNGNQHVGGVCGFSAYSAISNCYNTGAVSGNGYYVGGVCGFSAYGAISNCYNTGAVSTNGNYVGGVCGYNEYGTISNCYNTGAVSGSNYVGGVCGSCYVAAISNCYNIGAVSGNNKYVGGVCGYNRSTKISNCYYDSTIYSGNAVGYNEDGTVSENVLGKTSEQFKSGEVCYLLNKGKTDGTQAWYQDLTPETGDKSPVLKSNGSNTVYAGIPCMSQFSNTGAVSIEHSFDEHGFCTKCGGYQPAILTTDKYDINGDGTKDEVYEIGNAGQLYWFAALVNGILIDGTAQNRTAKAVLTADITVNTGVLNADGTLASDVSSFRSWTPIGNRSGYYQGIFDGQNHTVRGLYLNDSQTNYVGLFGYVGENGKISNAGVVDSYFKGKENVGGVCGYGVHVTISNCYNTGAVSGSRYVGGVCGFSNSGAISNCYNTGAVSGSSSVGGVCGYSNSGTITNCYFDSTVYSGNAVGSNNSTVSSNVLGKTSEQFKSGEVAYLLSQGCIVGEGESAVTYDGSVWGQTLSSTGKQDYPVLGGEKVYLITVYAGCKDNPGESKTGYSNTDKTVYAEHDYNENGFCTKCNGYQPATDSDGDAVYEIGNVGNLLWFAGLVNGTLTDGTKQNMAASAKLVNDIDFGTTNFTAIGKSSSILYAGTFDGNGHTIKVNQTGSKEVALFGNIGSCTIKNLTVTGTINTSEKYAAGFAMHKYGTGTAHIQKCISDVIINSSIDGDGTHGGIIGVVDNGTLNINNCAFTGAINGSTTNKCGGFIGYTNKTSIISNSYVSATFGISSAGCNIVSRMGGTVTVTNCYYLNNLGNYLDGITKMTDAQFANGEVCYLLNNGKTDGTQTWYQNLTQETGDKYPVLKAAEGNTVYGANIICAGVIVGKVCSNTAVTDVVHETHDMDENGFCSRGCFEAAHYNETNGVYEISNAGQYNWFAGLVNGTQAGITQNRQAKAVLTKDVDFGSHQFISIGGHSTTNLFEGTFDGQGHTLTVNQSGSENATPFGYIGSCTIENLTVKGVINTDLSFTSGIAACKYGTGSAYIKKCISDVTINSSVVGDGTHGGILGTCEAGTMYIQDCGFTGAIKGKNTSCCGGFVGYTRTTTNVSGSYISATFDIQDTDCDIVSRKGGTVSATGCYFVNKIGTTVPSGMTQVTQAQVESGEVCYLLNDSVTDGTQAWYQDLTPEIGDKHPVLTNRGTVYCNATYPGCVGNPGEPTYTYANTYAETVYAEHDYNENGFCTKCNSYQPAEQKTTSGIYEIANAGNLYWFAQQVNSGNAGINAELTKNITVNSNLLTSLQFDNETGEVANGENFRNWTPVGNSSNRYSGTFDGQNHIVSGLYFNENNTDFVGLFGSNNGKIKNVGIVDSYFNGNMFVSGVCGSNVEGSITNCYNTGTVDGASYVSGVCASNGAFIINCYNRGSVSGNSFVGGVCASNGALIANSYNAGKVNGESHAGGICGANGYLIANCYYDNTVYNGSAVDTIVNENAVSDNVLGKTTEQFKSGEVAYLLSQGYIYSNTTYDGSIWGQNIGTDLYPVLGGLPVYYRDAVYTNTYGILTVGTQTITASNNPITWYEFTPTETGSYQFSSTQLTAGNLYVNTTKTESDYTDITTSPTYHLDAATTYYVAVSATPGSYDLTITRLNNTPTAMDAVTASQIYAANGRIVCDGEFRIYDLLGRDVTRLNGSLQGVYVVITADAAQTVIVK